MAVRTSAGGHAMGRRCYYVEPHELYAGLRFSVLLADHYQFASSWVYPESIVPYSLLRLVTWGSATFSLDGTLVDVSEGDVVHIPEGTRLACHASGKGVSFISVRFVATVKLGDVDFLTAYFGLPAVTRFENPEDIRADFESIHDVAQGERPGRSFHLRGKLDLIVGKLIDQASVSHSPADVERLLGVATDPGSLQQGSQVRRDPRVERVVDFLTRNSTADIDVETLARVATLSPSALRRLFKEHTGKTIVDFVTELRMMRAARLLLITSERVGDIGRRVGYADQNYFARVFRGVFGVPPNRYRTVSREQQ